MTFADGMPAAACPKTHLCAVLQYFLIAQLNETVLTWIQEAQFDPLRAVHEGKSPTFVSQLYNGCPDLPAHDGGITTPNKL
jgi:hypothetical protein